MTDAKLTSGDVDDVARMLMALVQEVWVLRDRMAITELLLAERAGITAADIDDYVPSPAAAAELERLRDQFAARIVGAPIAARERSVDEILRRAGFADRGSELDKHGVRDGVRKAMASKVAPTR